MHTVCTFMEVLFKWSENVPCGCKSKKNVSWPEHKSICPYHSILVRRKPLPAEIIYKTAIIGSKNWPQIKISYISNSCLKKNLSFLYTQQAQKMNFIDTYSFSTIFWSTFSVIWKICFKVVWTFNIQEINTSIIIEQKLRQHFSWTQKAHFFFEKCYKLLKKQQLLEKFV